MTRCVFIPLLVTVAALLASRAHAAPQGKLVASWTLQAGKTDRVDTPACYEWKGRGKLPASAWLYETTSAGQTRAIPCQIERHNRPSAPAPKIWWIVSGTLPAGKTRTYQLRTGPVADPAKAHVVVKTEPGRLLVVQNGVPVFQYNTKPLKPAKEDYIPKLAKEYVKCYRTGYIHPLWSVAASGKDAQRALTHDFPGDHLHHHGIWFPWTNTTFEGKHVDFWNQRGLQGTVRLREVIDTTSGPVWGGFRVLHEFVALKADLGGGKTGEKRVLDEIWDVRVFNTGGATNPRWLFDITSTQSCASKSPLTINKYRYGGLGYRAAKEWTGDASLHLTSEGKDRRHSDATRPRWTIVGGAIDGHWDAVTLMSHPRNINHPEPVRTWANPKQHTFFGFAPVRASGWEMVPGKSYVFRYRFLVVGGKGDAKESERAWQDFAHPPKTRPGT